MGGTAERGHQRIVLGVLDPLEVAGHVTAYERRVGFGIELDEVGNLLVGNTSVRHGRVLISAAGTSAGSLLF